MIRRSSCSPIACWILARTSSLVTWSFCMRCVVSCGSTSFPWLVFFFGALLWGSMIYNYTGIWMWQGSISVVPWNWEKYFCHSKLVSTLSVLPLSVLSWRVSQAWNPHQVELNPGTWSLWLSQASVYLPWFLCWCVERFTICLLNN